MWDPQTSPRTPILYEHWISEGVFSFSPTARNGTPVSIPILTNEFRTPLSNGEDKYVIIPLHTPPKIPAENVVNKPSSGSSGRSNVSRVYSPLTQLGNGTQPHRRSPEKRFHSPGPICRICHDGDKEEALLSPCNCSGSMQLVHKSCLEKWLSTSNSDHCELCMKELPIRKEARPIWQWFSMAGSTNGPQGFYADLTCVILLTPLCLLSIYLCAIGAADYMKHGVWEGTGLAALSCFLLGTYIIWCYITIKFHWQTVQSWRTSNQVIYLMDKECRRRDQRVSDSTTPRSTVITSAGWHSPPEVRVFYPSISEAHDSTVESQPNMMDASLQGFNVPSIL